MNWKEQWIVALDKEYLFENSSHRTRFKELLDCFADYPFFTKGLCKCMYCPPGMKSIPALCSRC